MAYFQFFISACLQAYLTAAPCSGTLLTVETSPDYFSIDDANGRGTYIYRKRECFCEGKKKKANET